MHGLALGTRSTIWQLAVLLVACTVSTCAGGRLSHTTVVDPLIDKHACINRQRWFCEEVFGLAEVKTTKWKQLPNGVNILLHGGGNDIVSYNLDVHNEWEGFEVDQIIQLLEKNVDPTHPAYTPPLFVDIGANIGHFTTSAAKAGYMVYAFEGMRQNALMVRSTLCANPDVMSKVILFHAGLGDQRRTCKVWVLGHNVGDGTLDCSGKAEGPPGSTSTGDMHIYTLDTVLSEDIRVLKLDVEGFEPHVTRGAHQLLSSHKVNYIISEFNKEYLVMQNKGLAGITEWLDTMVLFGYKVSLESPAGPFLSTPEIKALPDKEGIFSLFFTHNRTASLPNHGAGVPRAPYLKTAGRRRLGRRA